MKEGGLGSMDYETTLAVRKASSTPGIPQKECCRQTRTSLSAQSCGTTLAVLCPLLAPQQDRDMDMLV